MKILTPFLSSLLIAAVAIPQGYVPKAGFVPDARTAIGVAEAVLKPVYGEENVISEQPFRAHLEKDIWTVSGTLYCKNQDGNPTVQCHGGVATVQISKTDGRILSMTHGK